MMKKNLLFTTLALFFLAISPVAAGILELRGGVGMNAASPDDFEDRVNAETGESLSSDSFDNFNADVFFDIPVLPIGIGVRHEWINSEKSSGGKEWDIKANNLSLLVDWRIINTGIYVGPIIGIGYPWADVEFTGSSDKIKSQIDGDQLSYSAGAEFGVKLGRFLVGAEAGYLSMKLEKTESQNNSVETEIDLSGFYGKVMAGISFF